MWIIHVFICIILLAIVTVVLVACILVRNVNLVLVFIGAIYDCRGTMYVASIIDIWPRVDALRVTGVRVVLVVGWGDHRLLGRRGIVWRRWMRGIV